MSIYKTIRKLVNDELLTEPFTVGSIRAVSNILAKSPSFLSKHALGNPGKYTPFFIRTKVGVYKLNPEYDSKSE